MASLMKKASAAPSCLAARPVPSLALSRPARAVSSVRAQAAKDQEHTALQVVSSAGLVSAASLMFASNADAAVELSQLAASDNRVGIIATLFLPALGWVGFNIAQPLFNQIGRMDDMRRSVTAAVGLGAAAALLIAESASASTEVAQLAASDNRVGIIATLFVPALGWVAFNIAQPLFNQVDRMDDMRRSVTAAVGLGAATALLMAESASASTEVAQLAASDNRVGIIATLFVPALGWVAFNIAQPFFNQLDRMKK